jgi:hypothetical protein
VQFIAGPETAAQGRLGLIIKERAAQVVAVAAL